jgi:AraC-like DNA-binding protein
VLVDTLSGYREYAPPAVLRAAVSCLWVGVTPAGGAPPTLVLPDACADLIWQCGRGVFVAGPDTGPVPSSLPPGTVLAGVRLRPGAGGPALGMPLSALLDQRVDASDLRRERPAGPAADLARLLPGWITPDAAMCRLVRVARCMMAAGPPDPLVIEATRRLGSSRTRVDTLAADLGVSERQLHRRCRAAVGYGPATLRRVLRFRRFVSSIDETGEPADLAGLAAETGYADQAHLTRESTRLAGLPPAALAHNRQEKTGPTTGERKPGPQGAGWYMDPLQHRLPPPASLDASGKSISFGRLAVGRARHQPSGRW